MSRARDDDEPGQIRPFYIDPKRNRIALTWLTAAAVLLAVWHGARYWTEFTATVDTHTVQIGHVTEKVDKLIQLQDRRFEWQQATLRSIADRVGASSPKAPAPDPEARK